MTDSPSSPSSPHSPSGGPSGPADARRRRATIAWGAAGAAAVALTLVVVAGTMSGGAERPGDALPTATATGSASAGPSPSASPSASAGDEPAAPVSPMAPSARPAPPEDPADFAAPAAAGEDVVVRVARIEAVQGEASQPGEVAGPALRFTVEVANGTGGPLDLTTAVVNAYSGPDSTPAPTLAEPGSRPFPTGLEAGETGTGVFVFAVPEGQRGHVELTLEIAVDRPLVVFAGSAV